MKATRFSMATLYLVVFVILLGCINNKQSTSLGVTNTELGNPPGTYSIVNDKDEVKIPFEFFGMNPMIQGEINGKKVKFLIDNGILWDQIWFYNGEVDSINLQYKGKEEMNLAGVGESGNTSIKEANDIDVTFGDIQFFKQPSLVSIKGSGYDKYFPGMNGQVCGLFFKHFIVTFDFDENMITLTKPAKFNPAGKGQPIPMQLDTTDGSYYIPITLQLDDFTKQELDLSIDIGTIFPLYLIENKKYNINIPENSEKSIVGYGASGAIYGHKSTVKKVSIGDYFLKDVTAKIIEKGVNSNEEIVKLGTFGLPLMKRFNITLDYFNQLMYFKPNTHFEEPFVD